METTNEAGESGVAVSSGRCRDTAELRHLRPVRHERQNVDALLHSNSAGRPTTLILAKVVHGRSHFPLAGRIPAAVGSYSARRLADAKVE